MRIDEATDREMARPQQSLQRILTAITVAMTVLACVVAAMLVGVTSAIGRANATLVREGEGIRLLEEAELDILLHERTREPVIRREVAGSLRSRLRMAGRLVSSADEQREFVRVEAPLEAYLKATPGDGPPSTEAVSHLEAAYAALESVVGVKLDQIETASQGVDDWDRLADVVGVSTATLILLLSGGLLWWLNARAFRPMLALARSMERFSQGDRGARAEVAGPSELREMALRFNQMATAIAAQREAQMTFLGGVAHDLRNPLSVLKVAVANLRSDRPLPPEPKVRKMLEMVGRQVGRLERMVTDLVDLAGIEAGKLQVKLERYDLRALIGGVTELFEGGSRRHRLVVSMPDEEVPVRADPLRIEQVLGNLVSNAIKYSPEADRVEISLSRRVSEALLCVIDHGIGIREEDQSRLFEPFRRVGFSAEEIPGAGLGLFVVRQIVEAHGGRIEVQSAPDRGSTFCVYLPLAPAEAAPAVQRDEVSGHALEPRPNGH